MANENFDAYLTNAKRKREFGRLSGYHNSTDFMQNLQKPEPYQMPESPSAPMQNMENPIPSELTTNLLGNNMLMATPQAPPAATTPKEPSDTFSDYWKTPVVGKIPLDRFVQMAGMISHSFAPDTPWGRMGANLQQMGSLAAAERARREEKERDRQLELPKEALQLRLLEAKIKGAEKDPALKKALELKLLEARIKNAEREPSPQKPSYHYVADDKGNVSVFADGKLIPGGSGKGKTKTVDKIDSKKQAWEDIDKSRTAIINLEQFLNQTNDMGEPIALPERVKRQAKLAIKENEARIKELSGKWGLEQTPTTLDFLLEIVDNQSFATQPVVSEKEPTKADATQPVKQIEIPKKEPTKAELEKILRRSKTYQTGIGFKPETIKPGATPSIKERIQGWAGKTTPKEFPRIGEGDLETAIRQAGFGKELPEVKDMAANLKKQYPNLSEAQLIDLVKRVASGE